MSSQYTRPRPGSARALLAVVLLAGVFAMHGLTGNHDVTMAMTHPAPVPSLSAQPAPTTPRLAAAHHSVAPPQEAVPHRAAAPANVVLPVHAAAPAHSAAPAQPVAPDNAAALVHVAAPVNAAAPAHSAAPVHAAVSVHVAASAQVEHVVSVGGELAGGPGGPGESVVGAGAVWSLGELSVRSERHGHGHSMGDVCLAMLAALLLALIGALARRSLTLAYPIEPSGSTVLVVVDGPDTLWRTPSLSKLCVLRT